MEEAVLALGFKALFDTRGDLNLGLYSEHSAKVIQPDAEKLLARDVPPMFYWAQEQEDSARNGSVAELEEATGDVSASTSSITAPEPGSARK